MWQAHKPYSTAIAKVVMACEARSTLSQDSNYSHWNFPNVEKGRSFDTNHDMKAMAFRNVSSTLL